jgi:sterol desaturase/sphingolipid hydroxylase (fatty acid hydroxylase superfamily)
VRTVVLLALAVVIPLVAVVLASADARRWLSGTGSIRQTLSNAGVGALFLVVQLGLRGTLIAVFAGVATLVPWALPQHPVAWVLAFVLLDLVYYVQHRLEHAVPLLWAIHAVHHQSRDYNLSVSFRVGALSSLSTISFHSLLALAGVKAPLYASIVTVHAVLLFTLHARTKFALGPGRFFNAPVFHRVHHGAEDAYIDKNFGGVLLVFDRLFGTFAPYVEEPSFGVVGEGGAPASKDPLAANLAPFAALRHEVARQPTLLRKIGALFFRAQ